jgi:hypothetical protein
VKIKDAKKPSKNKEGRRESEDGRFKQTIRQPLII